MMQVPQQTTIAKAISFSGIGVHSGEPSSVTLKPALVNTGIIIQNANDQQHEIKVGTIVPQAAMHATVIVDKTWKISTIEHVMAAVSMMGIDNVIVEINGNEVPILDGSALPFVQGIEQVGVVMLDARRQYLTPKQRLRFEDNDGRCITIDSAVIMPATGERETTLSLAYSAQFGHALVGDFTFNATITRELFRDAIAPARTFGFLSQLPFLRKNGLAQGTTLGNTVVVCDDHFLNELRFEDEFVRHKVLDLIGDLTLLGLPLIGTVTASKTGHSFNRLVIEHFIKHPEEWVVC